MTLKWAVDTQPEFMCLRESSDSANPFVSAKTVHITPKLYYIIMLLAVSSGGGSVAEWLACWTQAQ